MVFATKQDQITDREELTPDGESNTDPGTVAALGTGFKGEFWGDLNGKAQAAMQRWLEEESRWQRDSDQVKAAAPAIYGAERVGQAQRACERFRARWSQSYPAMVRPLEKDLPQRLRFLQFPRHLWSKLRTTNLIERCLVEVRRRTRPLVCFVNLHSVDRII